jgi:Holliday junction resolvase
MSTATRGRALEHEIRELLRRAGYSVTRGAGSKGELDLDGCPMKVDLIATKTGGQLERQLFIVGVQCKLRRRNPN